MVVIPVFRASRMTSSPLMVCTRLRSRIRPWRHEYIVLFMAAVFLLPAPVPEAISKAGHNRFARECCRQTTALLEEE